MNGARRAVIAGAVAAVATGWLASPPPAKPAETPVPEVRVEDAGVRYKEAYDWCGGRFPYRTDLQEACRWGAFEMLPREPDERVTNA